MASIKKDPNSGNWYFVVYYYGEEGKRKPIRKFGYKRRAEAEAVAKDGSYNSIVVSENTFEDYFKDWVNTFEAK